MSADINPSDVNATRPAEPSPGRPALLEALDARRFELGDDVVDAYERLLIESICGPESVRSCVDEGVRLGLDPDVVLAHLRAATRGM